QTISTLCKKTIRSPDGLHFSHYIMPVRLFKVNLSTLSLKFSLDLLSLSLGNALFNNLRCAVNKLFSLFQAKTCDLANHFDDFNLGSACCYKLYVKLILLLCCCSSVSGRCCNYNACCCRYAKLFFTCFN